MTFWIFWMWSDDVIQLIFAYKTWIKIVFHYKFIFYVSSIQISLFWFLSSTSIQSNWRYLLKCLFLWFNCDTFHSAAFRWGAFEAVQVPAERRIPGNRLHNIQVLQRGGQFRQGGERSRDILPHPHQVSARKVFWKKIYYNNSNR